MISTLKIYYYWVNHSNDIQNILKNDPSGILSFLVTYLPAQVKVVDNPSLQDPSSILELEKPDMGLLITRVSLADNWDDLTIHDPANSLLVYNTNSGGGADTVSPGLYYRSEDQGKWTRLATGKGGGGTRTGSLV